MPVNIKKHKSGRGSTVKRIKNKKTSSLTIDLRPDRKSLRATVEIIKRDFKNHPASAMPANLKPMLATITKKPFNDKDWLFEIKWDGYRSLSYIQEQEVLLRSRSNLSFNETYKPITDALKTWGISAVIDGEITVVTEN